MKSDDSGYIYIKDLEYSVWKFRENRELTLELCNNIYDDIYAFKSLLSIRI